MTSCPCDRERKYQECCESLHERGVIPHHAEELMRSRYSAYALKKAQYLLDTWHPSTRPTTLGLEDEEGEWIKLKVISHRSETEGLSWVHFKAFSKVGGQISVLEERSRFVKEEGRWLYVDGDCEMSAFKWGRNEPCLCGSEVKFKRCCGR